MANNFNGWLTSSQSHGRVGFHDKTLILKVQFIVYFYVILAFFPLFVFQALMTSTSLPFLLKNEICGLFKAF